MVELPNGLWRLLMTGSMISALPATPAAAERWLELPYKRGATYRIDLDSLRWDGPTVKYRVDIRLSHQGVAKHSITTAVIDCATGQRKALTVEYPNSDGPARSEPLDGRWRAIEPWWGAESARRFLCEGRKNV